VAISVVGCFWGLLRHFVPRNDTKELLGLDPNLKQGDTLILLTVTYLSEQEHGFLGMRIIVEPMPDSLDKKGRLK